MTSKTQNLETSSEKTSFFRVSGLDCGSCAIRIETSLAKMPGVEAVDASITSEIVTVHHRAEIPMAALADKLDSIGYGVSAMAHERDKLPDAQSPTAPRQGSTSEQDLDNPNEDNEDHHGHAHHSHAENEDKPWWQKFEGIVTVACTVMIAVAYLIGFISPMGQTAVLLLAMLVGLCPIGLKAWRGLRSGFPFSIESLLLTAAIGAIALGAIAEAAIVVLLFLIGELLEGIASGQARRGIRGLTDLIPKTAFIERSGTLVEAPISDLKIGDIIVARPGDRIGADGEIVNGSSGVDDSPVTGESAPKTKIPGDTVFAGSINQDATLRIRVTTDTSNNTISRIARLVEQAQDRKSPTQRFINRFSGIYTPIVFVLGFAVAVLPPLLFGADWITWIYRGLAVLLIGCPCALVISTPAAIASGIAVGTRRGLLLKGGEVLEKLAGITMVAFDKTGTLTTGVPSVTDFRAYGMSDTEVLSLAASVEASSSHPLAKAIVAHADGQGLTAIASGETSAVPGKGVSGTVDGKSVFIGSPKSATEYAPLSEEQKAYIENLYGEGKTVAIIVISGSISGILGLRDEAKTDAAQGIKDLKALGVKAVMLTGDNRATAQAIAARLGIGERSELLPQDKMEIVKQLQAEGETVAKVGDGINDAPALAAANVGIAMAGGPGGGTDIALETGDAAILQGRVADVAAAIALARRTMRNIHQNLTIALGLKAVFLVTTILGITGLWPAILADTGATLLVTANALRLLWTR